ncbi:hypothetical protein ACHAXA_003187 [Cyclostephanos tholiformis]|uniref:Uncharacterized protein n=1 Tax=Cyclostephanos tholiformis TaxID=382380 RepID=A0ABD3SSL9_9STRA
MSSTSTTDIARRALLLLFIVLLDATRDDSPTSSDAIILFASYDDVERRRASRGGGRGNRRGLASNLSLAFGDDPSPRDASDGTTVTTRQRRDMVVFRSPSRHTYGFAGGGDHGGDDDDERRVCSRYCYDLPAIELRNLLCSIAPIEDDDVRFVPVDDNAVCDRSPRWIESARSGMTLCAVDYISMAASRAVLTHATFSIDECLVVTDEDWRDSSSFASENISSLIGGENHRSSIDVLGHTDAIDMSDPNMSRDSRTTLINMILCLIDRQEHDVIKSAFGMNIIARTIIGFSSGIEPRSVQLAHEELPVRHYEGPIERRIENFDAARVTSTAMEPEIGFLMANLALAGMLGRRSSRVLDPCCGSGRLLLYAASLGATEVVGVDSDPNVWDAAEWVQRDAVGGESRRAVPTFFVGDVRYPSSTDVLCSPNSVDAIVCDPPYNIGAPILVDGRDMRPRSYHDKGESRLNNTGGSMHSSHDIVPSILSIAANVLVRGGRIVFLLPVRGADMTKSLEELLSMRGFSQEGDGAESCHLRLMKNSSRRQMFSPTFSRWLVCMEKW